MAELSEEQKLFVVDCLATYSTPSQVVEQLAETFAFKASAQQICAYNPSTVAGARLSEELKARFAETRQRFLAARADIPITHKNYRLKRLQDLLDNPMTGRSPKTVIAVLKLYEEIDGGVYQRQKQDDSGAAEGLKILRDYLGVKTTPPPTNGKPTRTRTRKTNLEVDSA